jgi:DNA-binding CsgD family transcriptional regulator
LAAGRYAEAAEHVRNARAVVPHDPLRRARLAVIEAQVAISQGNGERGLSLAGAALAAAEQTGQVDVQCEALEVIGRAVRVRDVAAAEHAFERAYQLAAESGLAVWRVRAMQELGTIDMFESFATDRLERARREAMAAGTLSIGAVIDLQLAATYTERADVDLALEAARRCEETSRRLGLATLPMSITVQSFAHARAGRHAEMEAAIEAALATGHDRPNVVAGIWGNSRAIYHLCRGDLSAASAALDQSTDALRQSPGGAYPFTGLWALVRTVLDDGGDDARRWVHALASDTPISRAIVTAADAVAAGRRGEPGAATADFAAADTALARYEGEFHRHLVRMLVAPCAASDGWGEPVNWLRGALAAFEEKGFAGLAESCRARLREAGVPVPRRAGARESVPAELAALGVTARELTVLALLADGGSNKAIAEQLFLSSRTVEKHVERLMMKAGTTRAGLAELAHRTGVAG